jgi:OPT oligopeptide transporter protein
VVVRNEYDDCIRRNLLGSNPHYLLYVLFLRSVFWSLIPSFPVTNTWDSAFLPISSFLTFDNTGSPFSAKAVVTNGLFDRAKYEAYSPLLMPAALAVAYGAGFGAFSSIFVHTFCMSHSLLICRIVCLRLFRSVVPP